MACLCGHTLQSLFLAQLSCCSTCVPQKFFVVTEARPALFCLAPESLQLQAATLVLHVLPLNKGHS